MVTLRVRGRPRAQPGKPRPVFWWLNQEDTPQRPRPCLEGLLAVLLSAENKQLLGQEHYFLTLVQAQLGYQLLFKRAS